MSDRSAHTTTSGANNLRLDRRLLASAEILIGAGAILWVAGWAVGAAALRRAVQDWFEQLEQSPSELAVDKWQQLLHATTAGTNAYRARTSTGS